MAVKILLDGEDVSGYRLAPAAFGWNDQVNGRGAASITFRSEVGGWRPEDGQELLIVEDDPGQILTSDDAQVLAADAEDIEILTGARRLFGGVLLEPEEWEETGSAGQLADGTPVPPILYFSCAAADFSAICDRRLVSRLYEGETVDAIVADIVRQDLDGDFVGTTGIIAGPRVEKAVFDDVSVADALNDLAELTGYAWRIDPYRVMQFRPRVALVSTTPFDADVLLSGSVRVRPSREKYRNTQIVRAGTDLTDPRPEVLVGDGARRVFATAFPLGATPTVEESRAGGAWTAKTVGILGVEEGKDWYWNSGQAQVSQDDAGTLLAAPTSPSDPTTGDRVRVTYQGQFPVKTRYQDLVEIDARKVIEGGSGIYAQVEDRPQINSAQSAIDTAVALIQRYGRVAKVVEGRTRVSTFEPGQVVVVDLPNHELVGEEMLIESIAAQYNSELDLFELTVRAMSGDPFGGWQQYFRKLLSGGRRMVLGREGETLVLLRAAAEGATCSDVVAIDTMGPESRIGIMAIGTGEIGL